MPSGGDLVTWALQRLGVLAAGQTPSAEDMADTLALLNSFVDSLGIERFSMYVRLRTTQTLDSGTASYTIGTGGAINIVRPLNVERAGLILDIAADPPLEVSIPVFTDDDWAGISQKSRTGELLQGVYYDHGNVAGLGTIYPWPVPNTDTTQLVLYTPQAVTAFDQATNVILPQGYERMFRYNLAVEAADLFEKPISPRTQRLATYTLGRVKGANVRPTRLRMPAGMPGMRRGRGDIRAGV